MSETSKKSLNFSHGPQVSDHELCGSSFNHYTISEGGSAQSRLFAVSAIQDMAYTLEGWENRTLSGEDGVQEAYEAFKTDQRNYAESIIETGKQCQIWSVRKSRAKVADNYDKRADRKRA